MALEYQIAGTGNVDLSTIDQAVRVVYGLDSAAIDILEHSRHARLPGCDLFFYEMGRSNWARCIEEGHGFAPSIGLTFRFIHNEHSKAYLTLSQAIHFFMKQEFDFVLLANGESAPLVKKAGQLLVNRAWESQVQEFLNIAPAEYALSDLPKL